MSLLILLPRQDNGDRWRDVAHEWVTKELSQDFPEATILTCELPDDEPWNKAKALEQGKDAAKDHELVVMHDADVYCEGLMLAVEALTDHEWAIPHKGVFRLDKYSTFAVYAGEDLNTDMGLEQRAYPGTVGGGIVAMHAETFLRVPMDPRFEGWGQEDDAWALALYMLAEHPWRGKAPLFHLYHEPQERLSRRIGSIESKSLLRRYGRARTPEDMQALIDEVPTCSQP